MTAINPFNVNFGATISRLELYWYATLFRCMDNETLVADCFDIAESTNSVYVPTSQAFTPAVAIAEFPGAKMVVAVRGTSTLTDAIADVASIVTGNVVPWPGKVILSFAGIASTLQGIIASAWPSAPTQWIICGHSLGGAVAALLAELYPTAGSLPTPAPIGIIDFGSPKSGDYDYAVAQTAARERLVNHDDPIPLMPPTLLLPNPFVFVDPSYSFDGSFYHWGRRVVLHVDGTTTLPPDETRSALNVAQSGDLAYRVIASAGAWFASHDPGEYARRLRAQIALPYPFTETDSDYPSLQEIDALNATINLTSGALWDARNVEEIGLINSVFNLGECK